MCSSDLAKHGQERDREPFEFNLEQMDSKSTKPMVQGEDSILENPKIKEDSIAHDGNDNRKDANLKYFWNMVDQLHWNCEVDTNVEEIDHDKMLKGNLPENLSNLFEEDDHPMLDNRELKNYDSNEIFIDFVLTK